MVDWGALLGLMSVAVDGGQDPFAEAVRVQQRLFTSKPIHLGVEESMKFPNAPCGLNTDAERARRVRKRVREMRNSRGEWEPMPKPVGVALREVFVTARGRRGASCHREEAGVGAKKAAPVGESSGPVAHGAEVEVASVLRPALRHRPALERVGTGHLVPVGEEGGEPVYGRALTVADLIDGDRLRLAKWVR